MTGEWECAAASVAVKASSRLVPSKLRAELRGDVNGARRDICEMTMRLKVREAKLDPSLRDFFEQVGEQIVGLALAIEATRGNGNHVTQIAPTQAMNVIYEHQDEAARWLIERRDLAERRETLTMLVRAAFLVFLLVTVLLTLGRPP